MYVPVACSLPAGIICCLARQGRQGRQGWECDRLDVVRKVVLSIVIDVFEYCCGLCARADENRFLLLESSRDGSRQSCERECGCSFQRTAYLKPADSEGSVKTVRRLEKKVVVKSEGEDSSTVGWKRGA